MIGVFLLPEMLYFVKKSPTLVRWFGDKLWFKKICKKRLDKMVDSLQKKGVESTKYNDIEW